MSGGFDLGSSSTDEDDVGGDGVQKDTTSAGPSSSGAAGQWDVILEDVDEAEITARLTLIGKNELEGNSEWSPTAWAPKQGFNKLGLRRQIYRCPFRGKANASCKYQLRVSENKEGRFTLERGREPHADHRINNRKRGLSKLLKAKATSPSKKNLTASKVAMELRKDVGAVSEQELLQLQGALKYERKKKRDENIPNDLRNTFGGVQHWVDRHTKEALQERNEFGIHTMYVCGKPQIKSHPPGAEVINIAVSTENLLLNAYRQEQFGIPGILQIDCTHRVVLEGHVCMLFGTVDAAQHFHTVGANAHTHAHCHARTTFCTVGVHAHARAFTLVVCTRMHSHEHVRVHTHTHTHTQDCTHVGENKCAP